MFEHGRTRAPDPARVVSVVYSALLLTWATSALAGPESWRHEWPNTAFAKHSVELGEIRSIIPKDNIPSIDRPKFKPVAEITGLEPNEPVIGLTIEGDARAYPLQIMTWHEIVNDVVGGLPVAVTYCPLCNSAIVFDRRVAGAATEFGTTGKLRNSDLVMYDRTTESWWQQFMGEAIVGDHTGTLLKIIPARLESFARFAARHPSGKVLVASNEHRRAYGRNPYVGYDSSASPFLYSGALPDGIAPLARVIKVGDQAWSLARLRGEGRIEAEDLILTWEAGQASALDTQAIAQGRDVGNVVVQRRSAGGLADVAYDVTFAFVFHAFHPDGRLHR